MRNLEMVLFNVKDQRVRFNKRTYLDQYSFEVKILKGNISFFNSSIIDFGAVSKKHRIKTLHIINSKGIVLKEVNIGKDPKSLFGLTVGKGQHLAFDREQLDFTLL